MTDEEQIRLANAWAVNREAERRLQVRDFAKTVAASKLAYHGGYIFLVVSPRTYFPAAGTTYFREVMVRLTPSLWGTAAAQLIAERIIEEQWPDDE